MEHAREQQTFSTNNDLNILGLQAIQSQSQLLTPLW